MKTIVLFSIILGVTLSCGEQPEEISTVKKPEVVEEATEKMSPERYVEHSLRIRKNEKSTINKYYAECNGDDSTDLILTVNLLERAMNDAIAKGNVAKNAETGYMGHYNYLIFRDGLTKQYSPPIIIPSSAMSPASVSFENVQSDFYKDILVDFKVTNGGFREYYTIVNSIPRIVLQLPIYTELGTDTVKAYSISYEPGSHSLAKDIVVYKGKIANKTFTVPDEVYGYYPAITPTKEIERRWFFNPGKFKYFTNK